MGTLIIPIISIIKSFLPNLLIFKNADAFIKSRTIIAITNLVYLKVAFTCILNLTSADAATTADAANSAAAIAMLIIVGGVPCFYIAHSIIYYRELKSLRKKIEYSRVFSNNQ